MATGALTIDGSQSEGGGQVLRSSLALSLVTGRPFVIEKIRAARKKPGLMRQHLTAVLTAAEVGGAEVEGATLGSHRLVFRRGAVRAGDYARATLVLQTVRRASRRTAQRSLPIALRVASGPHQFRAAKNSISG